MKRRRSKMNLILRVLKPFGLHDDHEVGEFVPAPLKEVNKLVRDGYAEIVINNVGNNKLYDEHKIDGEYYPTWVTAKDLEPEILEVEGIGEFDRIEEEE
jgi:hypothetical protein